MSRVVTVR